MINSRCLPILVNSGCGQSTTMTAIGKLHRPSVAVGISTKYPKPSFQNMTQQSVRNYRSLFINPKHDDVPTLTTMDVTEIFTSDIGQAKEYSKRGLLETLRNREMLMNFLPTTLEELPNRRMSDSFVSAIIPLKSREEIRERYVSVEGTVRIGRILEDMDIFSVFCCFKHILNPKAIGQKNPYSVVTALVDSIHMSNDKIRNNEDVRLSGHVTYTGRSSMEVSLIIDQKDETGVYQKVLEAILLMVARDPMNTGAALINSLVGETPEEKKFIEQGKKRQAARKSQGLESLFKIPPNEVEREIIHNVFLGNWGTKIGGNKTNPLSINMHDTKLKTVFICHPQHRNRYNKVFGGFLMRQACELAFTNASIYAKSRPRFVNIDDIVFRRPVEIGSILRYSSEVGYIEDEYIHCPVKAEVINPRTGEFELTNEFQFTFKIKPNHFLPPLNFQTYQDAITYCQSRRHFKKMMEQFVYSKIK